MSEASTDQVVARLDKLEEMQSLATGECRLGSGEIAQLHPVLTADGLQWCCSHDDEHCTEVVAGYRP